MRASILAVGDELLDAYQQDTNSFFILERLRRLGHQSQALTLVRDHPQAIEDALRQDLGRAHIDLVVVSGGLGPTPDDRTFAAVAAAFGRELTLHKPTLERIQARLAELQRDGGTLGSKAGAGHRKMALIPSGWIKVIGNRLGMAPCPVYREGTPPKLVVLLPGVPEELRAVWLGDLEPQWLRAGGTPRTIRELELSGVAEARLFPSLQTLEAEFPQVSVGSYPHLESQTVLIRLSSSHVDQLTLAATRLDDLLASLGVRPSDDRERSDARQPP